LNSSQDNSRLKNFTGLPASIMRVLHYSIVIK